MKFVVYREIIESSSRHHCLSIILHRSHGKTFFGLVSGLFIWNLDTFAISLLLLKN